MRAILLLSVSLPLLIGGCGEKDPVAETKPTEEAPVSPHLKYEPTGGAVTITDCDESVSGKLVIPAAIEGKPVTSIGGKAFQGCTSLTSITIPGSVTSIGKSAFSRCYSLTGITIPDGVTSIRNYAFSSCASLTSITIPDSVTSIGVTTFYGCSRLMMIEVGAGNVNYTDVNGVLFNKKKTVLRTYPKGKTGTNYSIPDGVTSIGDGAFYECSSLWRITIPDGVTSIGKDAFQGCSSLTSITIPDSVTSIGDYAFVHCTSLTSITIPAAVAVIRNGVFDNCTSLTRLIFLGDAPEDKTGLINTFPAIYRKPEANGWGNRWCGRPVELIGDKP